MIGYIFGTSLREFLRPSRVAAWVAVVGTVFLIGLVWRFFTKDSEPSASFDRLFQAVILRVMALASVVFASLVVSQEVEAKTVTYWLVRPVPRWQIMLGRLLAATLAALGVGVFAELAGLVAVFGPLGAAGGFIPSDLALLAVGAVAYTGLFVLASLYLSKALIVGLVFAFGWETFVPNMAGDMFYLSVLTFLKGASPRPIVSDDPGFIEAISGALAPRTVEPGVSWVVLLAIAAITWVLCLWRFSNAEIVPKEESD